MALRFTAPSANERSSAVLVTKELIAAKGASEYVYLDTTAAPDARYYYWLMETETTGAVNEYGPLLTDLGTDGVVVLQPSVAVAGGVAVPVEVSRASGVAASTGVAMPKGEVQVQSAVPVLAQSAAQAAVQPLNEVAPVRPSAPEQPEPSVAVQRQQTAQMAVVEAESVNTSGAILTKREAVSAKAPVLDAPAMERQVAGAVDHDTANTASVPAQPRPTIAVIWVALGIAIAGAVFMMSLGVYLVFVTRRRKA